MEKTIKVNMMDLLNTIEGAESHDGIKVIGICTFCETIYPDFFKNNERFSIRDKAITEFIRKHFDKIHFYSAPREDFSEMTAIFEARKAGKKFVIVEDLS